MKYKFFHIPVIHSEAAETALNQFCDSHHVLKVDRQLIDCGTDSLWAVCISWSTNTGSLTANNTTGKRKPAIDYKEVLSEDDFAIYVQLRELRKHIAEQEGTAVYNIFTNEQLAKLVTGKIRTKADMSQIKGIGQAKMEKYADYFLKCLNEHL